MNLINKLITAFIVVISFSLLFSSLSYSENVYSTDTTAVVITDPQNDFLSPEGVTWGLVGKSVTENKTVPNIEKLMKTAKQNGYLLFISPHYYYPTDYGWKFEGTLEKGMHD